MKIAIIMSLLLHVVLLSYSSKIDSKQQQQKQSEIKVKIKQEPKAKGGDEDIDIHIISEIIEELQKQMREAEFAATLISKCDKFYMGIGIIHDSSIGKISKIAVGGPADLAGLKEGDLSLDLLDIKDKYPEGTIVRIQVLRNDVIMDFSVKIGKICTNSIAYKNK